MSEVPLGHQVVGLNCTLDVIAVDPTSNAHNHVLRTLSSTTINFEEIGPLEGFEAEADASYEHASR